MSWVSWQKWAHLIVDTGQQLYVPWALSEGQVLYRDITFILGPFSVYVHSLIFRIFGPGILYLAIFNMMLIASISVCIFHLIKQLSDSATATLATTAFIGGFAFANNQGWGGLNFVCPYSYELTHGVMLSVLALYQFVRHIDQPSPIRIAGMGFLLGLIYLTKQEVFLAAALALGTGWTILVYFDAETRKNNALKLGLFLVSFLLPIFLFVVYFAFHMSTAEAIRAIVSPWIYVFNSEIHELPHFRYLLGTLFWQDNLTKIAMYIFAFAMLIAGLFYLNQYLTRTGKNSVRSAFYSSAMIISLGIVLYTNVPWLEIPRPFPFILAGYGIFKLTEFVKNRVNPSRIIQNLPFFVFALFAFLLTLKIILNLSFVGLGFALALPATLAILVMLLYYLPRHVQRISGAALTFRSALFSLAGLVVYLLMSNSHFNYMIKWFPVGEGPDRIYDFAPQTRHADTGEYVTRGMITKFTLEYIDQNMEKDATLAVFPNMIMFNYLTRRKLPTQDIYFDPMTSVLIGEAAMLNRLQKAQPPYILFANFDYVWFGGRFFGKDYGKPIFEWVVSDYSLMKQIGPTPFTGQGFGVQIWKRKGDPIPNAGEDPPR